MLWLPPLLILVYVTITRATILGFGPPTTPKNNNGEFRVYWNVPTFMCHKYSIHFNEVSKTFGILQNAGDKFRGDQFAILYDPGMFPALLKDSDGNVVIRNGGVPQEGNLTQHLEIFREHLINQIPDKSFDGVGVIDFESWRPIFRQNWGTLTPYKDRSIYLVRKEHPFWSNKVVKDEATKKFESYGKLFMDRTLKTAKQYRPRARWGYYAYPYCYNVTPNQPGSQCARETVQENDKISWLFDAQDVILPSLYLRDSLTNSQKLDLVDGRVKEALRIARKQSPRQPVLPYYWYKYQDQQDKYLDSTVLNETLRRILDLGADGFIIWGSSSDLRTKEKCQEFKEYLNNVLGPVILSLKKDTLNETRYNEDDILYNEIDVNIEST